MEGVDNKQVTSRRDAMLERLKGRYPDKDFSDDELFFGQISDDYDQYDQDIDGYKKREEGFINLLAKYPSFAHAVTEANNGVHPISALLRQIGKSNLLALLNDPELAETFANDDAEYAKRLAREKELEEQYNNNLEKSLSVLEQVQNEEGISDETIDAAYALINRIAAEAIAGEYKPETVKMALNALNHDADVENARAEGAIAGKNAKIEEKLRAKKSGDGIAQLGGSNSTPSRNNKSYSIFDAAREAN